MSGGGNRGSSRGSSSRGSSTTECSEIKFETTIFSPVPAVLSTVKKGDELDIAVEKTGGISLVAITKTGAVLGTILAKENLRLITCMERGFDYVAIVKEIKSGSCTILIKSR
jgi:hypothetical protein